MYGPLMVQNCSKNLPFPVMSEFPSLVIRPFHVLLSVSTCGLKSPSSTIDSAHVTFCKAILHLKKTSTMLQRIVCTSEKCTVTASVV